MHILKKFKLKNNKCKRLKKSQTKVEAIMVENITLFSMGSLIFVGECLHQCRISSILVTLFVIS
jgi:hypothetical protein